MALAKDLNLCVQTKIIVSVRERSIEMCALTDRRIKLTTWYILRYVVFLRAKTLYFYLFGAK